MAPDLPVAAQVGLSLLLGAVAQAVSTALAMISWWRLPADAHWTERARRAWGPRIVCGLGPFCTVPVFGLRAADLGLTKGWAAALVAAAAVGAFLAAAPFLRRLLPYRVTLRSRIEELIVVWVVRMPALVVLIGMMFLLVDRGLDTGSIRIMAGGLALAVLVNFGVLIPLVHAAGLFQPAPERLWRLAAEEAAAAGLPEPRTALLRWHAANAMAFLWLRLIAFTPATLEILTDAEVRAVLAHELAHLRETPAQRLTRFSGVLFLWPLFAWPVWASAYGPGGVLGAVLFLLLGRLLFRNFSQKMERRADAAACGENPADLAGALDKIYRYNLIPAVQRGKRQSHPHLYDRLTDAGLPPDYPRPKPPALRGSVVAILVVYLTQLLLSQTLLRRPHHRHHRSENSRPLPATRSPGR